MFLRSRPVPRRSSLSRSVARATVLLVFTVLIAVSAGAVQAGPPLTAEEAERLAEARETSRDRLRELMQALLAYAEEQGSLPARAIFAGEQPLLSWRVRLLPYLGEKKLYDEFHLDEPWDSLHNQTLLERMPAVFRSGIREEDEESTVTDVVAPVGPMAAFAEGESGRKLAEFTDGAEQSIVLIETETEIPWTKPADVLIATEKPLPEFGGFHSEGYLTVMADGQGWFISKTADPKVVGSFFTINGGEAFRLPGR